LPQQDADKAVEELEAAIAHSASSGQQYLTQRTNSQHEPRLETAVAARDWAYESWKIVLQGYHEVWLRVYAPILDRW
jgi:hypothetical protein